MSLDDLFTGDAAPAGVDPEKLLRPMRWTRWVAVVGCYLSFVAGVALWLFAQMDIAELGTVGLVVGVLILLGCLPAVPSALLALWGWSRASETLEAARRSALPEAVGPYALRERQAQFVGMWAALIGLVAQWAGLGAILEKLGGE